MIQTPPDEPDLAQARAFVSDLGDRIIVVRTAAQDAEARAKRAHKNDDKTGTAKAERQAQVLREELAQLHKLVTGLSRRFPEVLTLPRPERH